MSYQQGLISLLSLPSHPSITILIIKPILAKVVGCKSNAIDPIHRTIIIILRLMDCEIIL